MLAAAAQKSWGGGAQFHAARTRLHFPAGAILQSFQVILFVQQQHAKFAMVKAKKTVCFHNHRPQTALCSAEAVEGDVENNFLRMLCCNNPLLNGLYGRD